MSRVVETPGVCGGYPIIQGTCTPVSLIMLGYWLTDAETLPEMFPHLSPEDIRAALDFYQRTPERVEDDIERNHDALIGVMTHD